MKFFILFLHLMIVTVFGNIKRDNFHCITIKSRPGACYYFVHENLNHEDALNYCVKTYNARLATLADENTADELIKAYQWWSKGTLGRTFRLGQFIRNDWKNDPNMEYCTTHNTIFDFKSAKVDVDEALWNRVFCGNKIPKCTQKRIIEKCKKFKFKFADDWYRVKDTVSTNRYVAIDMEKHKVAIFGFNEERNFICESPRYPKVYCEDGWFLDMQTRSCFKQFLDKHTHEESMIQCRSKYAALASINNKREWNFVRHIIAKHDEHTFFGLRYSDKGLSAETFTYARRLNFNKYSFNVDGSPPGTEYTADLYAHLTAETNEDEDYLYEYPPWGGYQPDVKKEERCILFEKDFDWHDYPCEDPSHRYYYLCRKMANQD